MRSTLLAPICLLNNLSLLPTDVCAASPQQTALISPLIVPSAYFTDNVELTWTDPPSPDGTGNLIFNSLNGLLKHQPNALYRNGHAIIAGTVAPGTLLYHSSRLNCTGLPPTTLEWVSFDPEHSYLFGSMMYTFQVVKPLKILYFDGSSATKMPSGPVDTQEILAHGEVSEWGHESKWGDERTRLFELCDWGKEFGLDGFVRMEFDFEIMLCNFASMEVVSALDLLPVHANTGQQPECPLESTDPLYTDDRSKDDSSPKSQSPEAQENPLPTSNPPRQGKRRVQHPTIPTEWVGSLPSERTLLIEAIQAGNWHDLAGLAHYVHLDYTRFVTFFDPKYESLTLARRIQHGKGAFRAGNVTKADADMMLAELKGMLRTWDLTLSRGTEPRVSWSALVQTVVERYSTRLEYLLLLLRNRDGKPGKLDVTQVATRARYQVLVMLAPYMSISYMPSTNVGSASLAPTIRHCSNVFTSRILSSTLTSSERLIKSSVETVAGEICRTLGVIWLEAFDVESKDEKEKITLVAKWRDEVERLMDWLGWANWAHFMICEPACGPHEFCTLPQWPMDMRNDDGSGKLGRPYCHSRALGG
ncbi:hypothetical protein FRB98_003462 [Tulasnella sp. 332]|nr:hypothetical protein FRB98_003462 [Tulasnella sp. 332]